MSIRSFLSRIPPTGPAEIIEHPSSDPRELGRRERTLCNQLVRQRAEIDLLRSEFEREISEMEAEANATARDLNEIRERIAVWARDHGVAGHPKLENTQEETQ